MASFINIWDKDHVGPHCQCVDCGEIIPLSDLTKHKCEVKDDIIDSKLDGNVDSSASGN